MDVMAHHFTYKNVKLANLGWFNFQRELLQYLLVIGGLDCVEVRLHLPHHQSLIVHLAGVWLLG